MLVNNQIKWSVKLLWGLLDYLDTSLDEFYNTNFKKYSKIYLYAITGKQRNISKGMNYELNRIFFRQLKLTEDDLLSIYKLMDLKDKGKLKYKQYKGEKRINEK